MRPPAFWAAGLDPYSREAAPVTRALLTPLAWLTRVIHASELSRARPEKIDTFVISIGGITLGGAGKTPVTDALRSWLVDKTGKRVATLSRGFGGRFGHVPLSVDSGSHKAIEVGDEPLMLAKSGESWIGRDKVAAAKAMAQDGVEMVLLDDGHQSLSIGKDLSILVLDADAPLGNGHVFPKGPLREPAGQAIERSDAIVWLGEADVPDTLISYGKPIFRAGMRLAIKPLDTPIVAFAGIGRPEKFYDALQRENWVVSEAISFGNHHIYKTRELRYLKELADHHNAQLVTTEKDYVRLSFEDRKNVLPLPVEIDWQEDVALDDFFAMLIPDVHNE